jgi:hypothetical protein
MKIGLLLRWGSFWIGAHWAPNHKRLCLNLAEAPPLSAEGNSAHPLVGMTSTLRAFVALALQVKSRQACN